MRPRPPVIEGRIVLPENRRLGFAEFGVPTGKPVFWFHGMPGARIGGPADLDPARRSG